MILTCPNCPTRYVLDPARLGSVGRLVRCGKCGHTWHQFPPADMAVPVEPAPEFIAPRPIPPGSNLPAIWRKRRRGGLGWAVLALLVAAVVFGGLLARERIVAEWPEAAELYNAIGIATAMPEQGLVVRNVSSRRILDNGEELLVVEGEVANLSTETRDLPPLRGALRDARQHDVQEWTFTVSEAKLAAGGVVTFSTTLKNPASEATEVSITLAALPASSK